MITFFIYLKIFLLILLTLVPVIMSVAFFTILERKVMASVQRRKGPSNIGFYGILQPFADGLKLLLKEISIPFKSNFFFFLLSPSLSFFISLMCWISIPFGYNNFFIDFNFSALVIFVINSFGVYTIIFPGISSNSKYTVLGSYRALSQFISYEILLSFIFLFIILICSSFSLIEIVFYQQLHIFLFLPLFPVFIIFFISILAETNRSPFDLPEAESELVSGYSTEYSASIFTFFFLAEYSNMILWAFLTVFFFLGGWVLPFFNKIHLMLFVKNTYVYNIEIIKTLKFTLLPPLLNCFNSIINYIFIQPFFNFFIFFLPFLEVFFFCLKVLIINFFFVLVRSAYPRYRFDFLLYICWKSFLPFLMGYFLFIYSFLIIVNFF